MSAAKWKGKKVSIVKDGTTLWEKPGNSKVSGQKKKPKALEKGKLVTVVDEKTVAKVAYIKLQWGWINRSGVQAPVRAPLPPGSTWLGGGKCPLFSAKDQVSRLSTQCPVERS